MRIVSLVPAATEMVVALGAEASLVGISHECDWPPSVRHLPRVTATPIDTSARSGTIDAQVRRAQGEGVPVIGIEAALLRSLAPDLILTQELCDVCAVTDAGIESIGKFLHPAPGILSLKARTLEGIFADIAALGARLDISDEADELIAGLRYRLGRLIPPSPRPRVVCIEWLDPIFLAGHWVPDLIAGAGGADVGAFAGSHSRTVSLDAIRALAPDLVLVAPCGFGLERSETEYRAFERAMSPGWGVPVWLLDGNAYTSRPGPRVVDGAERIAAAMMGRDLTGLKHYISTI